MHPLIHDWNAAPIAKPPLVLLNDETLRDGLQSPSVRTPSIEEKLRILHFIDEPAVLVDAVAHDVRAQVGARCGDPRFSAAGIGHFDERTRSRVTLAEQQKIVGLFLG